eukprot:SAG31_NODE_38955_length_292_cov_0.632124_1_plen_37_part_01
MLQQDDIIARKTCWLDGNTCAMYQIFFDSNALIIGAE